MFRLYKGETLEQWQRKTVNLRHREEEQFGSCPIQE